MGGIQNDTVTVGSSSVRSAQPWHDQMANANFVGQAILNR